MNEVDTILTKYVDLKIVPGFNYGIIHGTKIYKGTVGNKALIPVPEKNTIETIYDLASLTKPIAIVTLILLMHQKGFVKLTDKLSQYLPNFKYDDINIFQLLTHSSGLPADLGGKEITDKTTIMNEIYDIKKIYPTGENVVYSCLGYILLGEYISKIYNRPLDKILSEEVLKPLNMLHSGYLPTNTDLVAPTEFTQERGILRGIVHDEKACSLGGIAGNAGLFSTIDDLLNYCSMILNDGLFNHQAFLNKEFIDVLFQEMISGIEDTRKRSLGWIVGNNKAVIERENVISFSGFTGPSISIDRINQIAIILLTNRVHPTRDNNRLAHVRSEISNEIYKVLEYKL